MKGAVRISPIDGKLPNLALMRIAAWERSQGADVHWRFGHQRELDEPEYDAVYASAIFETSAKAVEVFRRQWPDAVIGGTGGDKGLRVEQIVPSQFVGTDYGGYPDFTASIGYAMRGCRFKCGFCIVPKMEGAPRSAGAINAIWRGDGFPRKVHLLDNDFFGNPEWRERIEEILEGDFKVCINQGINVRLIDAEQAQAIASIRVMDDQFKTKRIYTAWDNIGDEAVFFRGIDFLEAAGVKPDNIMVYMLVGYDPRETWERLMHRYGRMMERGVRPYPMVHNRFQLERPNYWKQLKLFQRWVITGVHKIAAFEDFQRSHKAPQPRGGLLDSMEHAA